MNTEKTEKRIIPGKNGGYRPGSGRKPDLDARALKEAMQAIKNHGMKIPDDSSKLTRIEMIYNKLYELGMDNNNIAALKEYLDRQLGKSKEKLDITTKGDKVLGFNYITEDGNNTDNKTT